jgi:hypothetical protein
MSDFWNARSKRERGMIVMAVLSIIFSIPMALMQSGGTTKSFLPAAEAHQKYLQAAQQTASMNQECNVLEKKIARFSYHEKPDTLEPKLINILQSCADKSSVHIREIRPLRVLHAGNIVVIPINLRLECPFEKTIPFLYYLENPANKLNVDRFSIQAGAANDPNVTVDAEINGYTMNDQGAKGSLQ